MPDLEAEGSTLPAEILAKPSFTIRLAKEILEANKGTLPLVLFLINLSSPLSPQQLARIREIVLGLTQQKGVVGLSEFADLGVIVTQIPNLAAIAEAKLILNTIPSLPETQDLIVNLGVGLYHRSYGLTPTTLLERALDGLKLAAENGGNKVGLVVNPGQNNPLGDQEDSQIIFLRKNPPKKKPFPRY